MAEPRRAFGPYRPAVGARADAPPLRPWTDLAARLAGGPVIATLNLHSTPRHREREFAAQIARLGERFDPLTEDGLDAITGGWTPPRPVVMPILFEGFRDNLEVVLPMIEAAGLVAWLVIPPGFLDLDAQDQRLYAAAHHLDHPGEEPRGERIALTWEEARAIAARGHVFGCHSRSHFEPRPTRPRPCSNGRSRAARR